MYKRVLLFGDSQTELGSNARGGWVSSIAARFCRQVDITNRGLSGYNTAWASTHFKSIIPNYTGYYFDMAVVWFGCNDAVGVGQPQHVPLPEYETNLTLIVCELMNMGILPRNILVLTPPTVDEEEIEKHFPGSRNNDTLRKYADAALRVATSRNCPSADLFAAFQARSDESLFTDGLHLSPIGNEIVRGVVEEFVKERVGAVIPCPDWKELAKI